MPDRTVCRACVFNEIERTHRESSSVIAKLRNKAFRTYTPRGLKMHPEEE